MVLHGCREQGVHGGIGNRVVCQVQASAHSELFIGFPGQAQTQHGLILPVLWQLKTDRTTHAGAVKTHLETLHDLSPGYGFEVRCQHQIGLHLPAATDGQYGGHLEVDDGDATSVHKGRGTGTTGVCRHAGGTGVGLHVVQRGLEAIGRAQRDVFVDLDGASELGTPAGGLGGASELIVVGEIEAGPGGTVQRTGANGTPQLSCAARDHAAQLHGGGGHLHVEPGPQVVDGRAHSHIGVDLVGQWNDDIAHAQFGANRLA